MTSQSSQLLSRFKGSLLGALVGDCLGAYFECTPGIPRENVFAFFADVKKAKGNVKKLDVFTDDTAMARSVALSLIEKRSYDARDMAERFQAEFHREPGRGYGGNVATVFSQLRDQSQSGDPDSYDVYEPARLQFDGSGSYGNGGAMRIAPAALFNYNKSLEESEDVVSEMTRLTHSHKHAILGAILEHHAVHHALNLPTNFNTDSPSKSLTISRLKSKKGDDKTVPVDESDHDNSLNSLAQSLDRSAFIDSLLQRMKNLEQKLFEQSYSNFDSDSSSTSSPDCKRSKSTVLKTYCEKLEAMKMMLAKDPDHEEVVRTLGHGVAAFQSVPAAIYSFLRSTEPVNGIEKITTNPFQRTVIYAVSLGGDTDTIASMAGAIAGAYYGAEAVPHYWTHRCEAVADAVEQATKLFQIVHPN